MNPQDVTNRPRLLRESNAIRVARSRPEPGSWIGFVILALLVCIAISVAADVRKQDRAEEYKAYALEVAE